MTGNAPSGYAIREPLSVDEFAQLVGIFQSVFRMPAQAVPPAWLMEDITRAGGITLGLWFGEEPVGCSFAFPGIDKGNVPYLYSDGLAVLPAHRGQNRAYEMKLVQREHAMQRGYGRIVWTFSALRSINTYLYTARLGAQGTEYLPERRGTLGTDWGTEGGIPFDEFLAVWDLDSERVRGRLRARRPEPAIDSMPVLTRCSGDASKRVLEGVADPPSRAKQVAVEVVSEYQDLVDRVPDLARDWHMKTRPLFKQLFRDGFLLTDCAHDRESRRAHYVFERDRG